MSHAVANAELIYSDLATEADLAELVDVFVGEIPQRLAKMQDYAGTQDWEGLRRLAHQLKGAAGSYGFAEVTPFAARLENALRESQPEEIILMQLNDLLDICSRLRSGLPV